MKTAAVDAGPRTARKPAPVLERTTFRTSRLAEFCSTRELVAQTGHPIAEWPLVILKELTDNAIDICEEKDIAPEIAVTVSTEEGTITVADNGPGIPPQTVVDVLDYTVRVSSREAYVSPTRGAQGNALKTTSAHWYDLARFERYLGAHIARDQDLGRERTVREFISEFRGLSGSAK